MWGSGHSAEEFYPTLLLPNVHFNPERQWHRQITKAKRKQITKTEVSQHPEYDASVIKSLTFP